MLGNSYAWRPVLPGRIWARGLGGSTALALLVACQPTPPMPSQADRQHAESARPASLALAQTYERSCMTCHTQVASGAPLVGFAPHWQSRLSQGMPTLLRHVREGLRGMPARGYCNDCGDAEFTALIAFMSTPLPAHRP